MKILHQPYSEVKKMPLVEAIEYMKVYNEMINAKDKIPTADEFYKVMSDEGDDFYK